MSDLEIITFGCRLNAYESEVMRDHARAAGLDDTVIVNTCAVTAEAERQARQAIRRARRDRPGARIVVTGCAAQIAPARFAAMPEVDLVLGNREKTEPGGLAAAVESGVRVRVNDIMSVRETAGHLAGGFDGRARAFVQVQNGCDHRCTFCVIPFGRGNNRSVAMGAVAAEVRRLVEGGWREVVLTGVDITAYGADLPGRPTLAQLVRRLLAAVPGLARLRLSSLDPAETGEDLLRLFAEEERLMPHLHLSLQAGDDMILKRMKRRHGRDDVLRLVERVRALRPDIALGADVIAGFPTETEAMFRGSLDMVARCGLGFLHVFPYSARAGTPAARMPQVPVADRRARAAALRAAGAAQLSRFLESRVGRPATVLIERPGHGRTEHYAEARVAGAHETGSLVRAWIAGVDGAVLVAETP